MCGLHTTMLSLNLQTNPLCVSSAVWCGDFELFQSSHVCVNSTVLCCAGFVQLGAAVQMNLGPVDILTLRKILTTFLQKILVQNQKGFHQVGDPTD